MEAGSAVMSCTGAQRGQLFLPSSFSGALEFSFISNNFPFNLCLLAASFLLFVLHVWKDNFRQCPNLILRTLSGVHVRKLLKSGVHQRLCTEEIKANLSDLLQGRARGVREGA